MEGSVNFFANVQDFFVLGKLTKVLFFI